MVVAFKKMEFNCNMRVAVDLRALIIYIYVFKTVILNVTIQTDFERTL